MEGSSNKYLIITLKNKNNVKLAIWWRICGCLVVSISCSERTITVLTAVGEGEPYKFCPSYMTSQAVPNRSMQRPSYASHTCFSSG